MWDFALRAVRAWPRRVGLFGVVADVDGEVDESGHETVEHEAPRTRLTLTDDRAASAGRAIRGGQWRRRRSADTRSRLHTS